jgi:hypothetical protein
VPALAPFALVREATSASLSRVVVHGAAACLLYAVVFVAVAIGRQDRSRYAGKLRSIAGLPALETA